MLFIRFVFTNVGKDAGKRLRNDKAFKTYDLKIKGSEDTFEFTGNVNDETLYEICCIVTSEVLRDVICESAKNLLLKTFGDFNSDEFEHISRNIMNKDFVEEIPGRMYVYLMLNGCVNPMGFYNFMCKDVKQQVLDCAIAEINKLLEINERADMIETLKYFSDMSLENVKKVVLFANPHGIEIRECIPPRNDINCEYSASETDVLAELVTLNPGCIEIHGRDEFLKNEISTVIEAVFENRIQYR